jgi:hypothetical protein
MHTVSRQMEIGIMANGGYEARVWAAHLPTRTVAFTFPKTGIPFAGGIFRIERVRTATEADEAEFPEPPEGICALCGQPERDQ